MSTFEQDEQTPQPPQPVMPEAESDDDVTTQKPASPLSADETTAVPLPQESSTDNDAPQDSQEAPAMGEPSTDATLQIPSMPTTDAQEGATSQVVPPSTQSQPLPAIAAMSVEDLLSLKVVSDPQISPDGTCIAYVVLQSLAESNTTSSAIWLVDISAGTTVSPRQISSGEAHDTQPRWSPDGQALAFLSDRTGQSQIYYLSMQGGEARQVSHLAQGVTAYSWHPAGQLLLAHSAWKPQDDQQGPAKGTEGADEIVYTRLQARWDGEGERYGRHQQLWLVPLAGAAMRLTSEPVDLVQSSWSPDGTEVVFSANRRADPDLSVSMALWVLTLSTGALRRLTPEDGLAQMPSWSPDGKWIAYLYTPDQTEAGNIVPWLVEARGQSNPRLAVPGVDAYTSQAWIIDELRDEYLAAPCWYPDSQALLVPFQERGQLHLYRLEIAQQHMQRLTQGNGRYISSQLSRDGQRIVMVRADWFTPGDIWSMDSRGQQPRKLTRINDPILQSHRLTRPRRISWQSFDGQEIEGFLYLPALPAGQKAPLVIAPHGGPSLAWGDSYVHEFQVLAGRGFAVLAPNPRGSAGYGEAFSRSVLHDWGGGDLKDLLTGLDHVIATEAIAGERIGIGGLSYGGYMTNWAISQSDRFKAAVSRNGISSIASAALLTDQTHWFALSMDETAQPQQRSALTFAQNIHTPLLLLHGRDDLRCPFSESYQLFVALRKLKRPVELVSYPAASHLMDWPGVGTPRQRIDRLRRTVQWYERFLA